MKLQNLGLLFLLAVLWGPSFLFIKQAVAEIPPFTLVALRVGIAALVLHILLAMQGRHIWKFGVMWRHFAVMGLVHHAFPFVMFSWGEIYIASALAAILNGTTPLFTIILAHFFAQNDRINPVKFTGVLVGFAGVSVLFMPSLLADGFQATTFGLLAIVLASASYGIAIVYSKNYMQGLPSLIAPTAQLTVATIYMIPFMLWEQPFNLPMPSMTAWFAVLILAVFGTAIAFVVYYYAVERVSATGISMVTYLIPIIGIILGVVVLDEQLGWETYVGCALIIAGVMVVNGLFRPFSRRLLQQNQQS